VISSITFHILLIIPLHLHSYLLLKGSSTFILIYNISSWERTNLSVKMLVAMSKDSSEMFTNDAVQKWGERKLIFFMWGVIDYEYSQKVIDCFQIAWRSHYLIVLIWIYQPSRTYENFSTLLKHFNKYQLWLKILIKQNKKRLHFYRKQV
jgi:hypothetical protein